MSGEIAVAFHGNEEDKGALEANEYIAQAIAADADCTLIMCCVSRFAGEGRKEKKEKLRGIRFGRPP